MIVFDKPFTDFNQKSLKHVEEKLGRKCLLGKSKVDTRFKELYKEETHLQYDTENWEDLDLYNVL
jgi:hypothetical protein